MKALLKLRASGRMIGIISHVEALKERINNWKHEYNNVNNFASYQKKPVLVGYFALASKYFHIDGGVRGHIGSNLRKRISKFADYDAFLQRYIVPDPLIVQLGKNYRNGYNELITGDELLQIACDTVKEGQRILGGKLVYLECEDVPSLIRFYEENGFCSFGKREFDGDERDKMKGQYLIQMLKYLGE